VKNLNDQLDWQPVERITGVGHGRLYKLQCISVLTDGADQVGQAVRGLAACRKSMIFHQYITLHHARPVAGRGRLVSSYWPFCMAGDATRMSSSYQPQCACYGQPLPVRYCTVTVIVCSCEEGANCSDGRCVSRGDTAHFHVQEKCFMWEDERMKTRKEGPRLGVSTEPVGEGSATRVHTRHGGSAAV